MDGSVGMGQLVDWTEVLLALRRHGWGPSRIARTINLPKTTVRSWMERGCEPGFSSGMLLIRLHDEVVLKRPNRTRFAVPVSIGR